MHNQEIITRSHLVPFRIMTATLVLVTLTKIYVELIHSVAPTIFDSFNIILLCIFSAVGKISRLSLTSIPFVVSIVGCAVYIGNLAPAVKYTAYFLTFAVFLSWCQSNKWLFTYTRRIFLLFMVVSLALYSLAYIIPDYLSSFFSSDFPSESVFEIRQDWDYRRIFYNLVLPANDPGSGILGIPRFYFMSAEPTLASIFIWPFLHISINQGKKISTLILLVAMLFSSSYSALLILGSVLLLSYRSAATLIVALGLIFLIFILGAEHLVGSARLALYLKLITEVSMPNLIGPSEYYGNGITPYGLYSFAHGYGLLPIIGYFLFVVSIFLKFSDLPRIDFLMLIGFVLLYNKAGEPFGLLIIFYLGFLKVVLDENRKACA